MSNQTEVTTTATIIRDDDELEGALLPVATAVGGAAAATPVSTFEYDTAISAEARNREPMAYSIPSTTAKSAVADDSKSRVKQAQQAGLIRQEEENEAIRRGNCQVFAKGYHAERAVEEANRLAHRRDFYDAEFQEEVTAATLREQKEREKNEQQAAEKKEQSKGYSVGGYETSEYQFGSDYEVNEYKMSEYKSVYD